MSAYTSQERVEGYLKRELTADELVSLDGLITGISNSLNGYLNREYLDVGEEADDVADSERYFDGSGDRRLFIDDMLSVTELELLDTYGDVYEVVPATDYILYPLNTTVKSEIYLRNRRFPCHPMAVRVTAAFSSGEVPAEVINAATALVGHWIEYSNKQGGMESIEGYNIQTLVTSEEQKIETIRTSIDHLRKLGF